MATHSGFSGLPCRVHAVICHPDGWRNRKCHDSHGLCRRGAPEGVSSQTIRGANGGWVGVRDYREDRYDLRPSAFYLAGIGSGFLDPWRFRSFLAGDAGQCGSFSVWRRAVCAAPTPRSGYGVPGPITGMRYQVLLS